MANELLLTVVFDYTRGSVNETVTLTDSVDVGDDNFLHSVQAIGTSEEAITLLDVSAGGYCMLRNLDSTNFVSIRQGTGTTNMIRLLAGEFALFRWDNSTTAPFAIADTAAVDLEVWLLDL